jgi:hypothetical protein
VLTPLAIRTQNVGRTPEKRRGHLRTKRNEEVEGMTITPLLAKEPNKFQIEDWYEGKTLLEKLAGHQ